MALLSRNKETPAPSEGGWTYPFPSPVKPSPLLLPASVAARAQKKILIKTAALAAVGSLVLALALSAFAVLTARSSTADLEAAQQAQAAAEAEVARYLPISTFYTELSSRQSALSAELAGDLSYARLLGAVYAAAPQGLEVSQVQFRSNAPCAGGDPFAALPAMGCIELTGEVGVGGEELVAAFISQLNAPANQYKAALAEDPTLAQPSLDPVEELARVSELPLLSDAFGKNFSTAGGNSLAFGISVNYSLAALTQNYIDTAATSALAPTLPAPAAPGAPAAVTTPAPAPATTSGTQQ